MKTVQAQIEDAKDTTRHLLVIIAEYKDAREKRHAASLRQDLKAVYHFDDEMAYWAEQLRGKMELDGIDAATVREMMNAPKKEA